MRASWSSESEKSYTARFSSRRDVVAVFDFELSDAHLATIASLARPGSGVDPEVSGH